jgi:hypothetical protein
MVPEIISTEEHDDDDRNKIPPDRNNLAGILQKKKMRMSENSHPQRARVRMVAGLTTRIPMSVHMMGIF